MPFDETNHAEYVDAWWTLAAQGLPPARVVALFERALRALWDRSHVTLGVVTLAAIVDRVLYVASENYPALATLKVDEQGIHFDAFRQAESDGPGDITEGAQFVLMEFLTVLGHLTDEILTPALHEELSNVALEQPGQAGGNAKRPVNSREPRS
ncbi:MAG: hypothetical protein ABW133_04040 [Polyangiaceae bacterium]